MKEHLFAGKYTVITCFKHEYNLLCGYNMLLNGDISSQRYEFQQPPVCVLKPEPPGDSNTKKRYSITYFIFSSQITTFCTIFFSPITLCSPINSIQSNWFQNALVIIQQTIEIAFRQ